MRPNRFAQISTLAATMLLSATAFASGLRARASDYEVQVLTPTAPARTFSHRGETWVLGQLGERYVIRVINHSGRRVEAVASVDGRDVIDGKPADFVHKRGYLIPPWGQVDIEGFRLSDAEVAAFRFARVADSYAAKMGNARNVGVIGVAIFPERYVPPPPKPPHHHPHHHYMSEAPGAAGAPAPAAPAEAAEGSRAEAEAPASAGAGRASAESKKASKRPGLGTEFGEAVGSRVESVAFERADQTRPAALIALRYDDRQGLLAQGIDVDGANCPSEVNLRRTASPFPESGYAAPPPGWRP